MSTNTHEQSKTCTNIVNWLSRATASVERATLAARLAGRTHETAADWLAARADARAAEDEAITLLCQAVPQMGPARHPGAAAAVTTLQDMGWKYTVGHAKWQRPGPELDASVQAGEELRGQGYTWAAPVEPDVAVKFTAAASMLQGMGYTWVNWARTWAFHAPGPAATRQAALRHQVAEATLLGMGYEWAPKRQAWVCTAPEPAQPDVPVKFTTAASTLQGLGLSWGAAGQMWTGPTLDPGGHERLKQAASLALSVRRRNRPAVEADAALAALSSALSADPDPAFPPTWDAEECRNAALEVLREMRRYAFAGAPGSALARLGRAVQREQ